MTYHCNRQNKHPLPTPILFFKIILRTSLQDGKLKLPNNFTRKYGGDMPNPMFLKPPDETEWEVFWGKNDGDIWLQKGWKEFATYYSLDHGHMVLFEYKHTCHFDVHICDKSTLEIDYPFHGTQDAQDSLDQISDDDSVKILDELPPFHKTSHKSPMSSPQPCKKLRTCTSGDVERSSTLQNLAQHVQIEGTNLEKSKFASIKKEPDEDMGGTTEQDNLDQIHDDSVKSLDERPPCRMARQKAPMSCPQPCKRLRTGTSGDVERRSTLPKLPQHVQITEEMDGTTEGLKVEQLSPKSNEALKKSTTFRSKNPSFSIVMKPSYVDGYRFRVPLQFAEKYLKKKERNVLLQVLDGRTWHCNYSLGNIFAGWKKFVSDNNLKVGDVCLFELTKIRGISLKVQIFPLAEESNSPPVQETVQGDGIHWLDPGRALHVGCLNINTRKDGKKTKRSSLMTGALKEASEFASENPFFKVKIWTGFRFRPHVPADFNREYLNNKRQIVKLQFGKKLWPVKFRCYPTKFFSGRLSSGWTLFARENELLDGDVCVFELVNKEDAVFDVHIFRCHY